MSALPRFSDIDLLGYGERVINLNSEIADRALDLRVAQQELNRPKISRFLIDQRCLSSCGPRRFVRRDSVRNSCRGRAIMRSFQSAGGSLTHRETGARPRSRHGQNRRRERDSIKAWKGGEAISPHK